MAIDQDKVLSLVRMKGPVLPAHIAKEISTNILFASAVLSELASSNLVKISSVKIGGSPLYYAPEQGHRLQQFSNYLHEKEKKAYDLLKQRVVLRDSEADPVVRVALRNIKDFAVPLNVTVNGQKEVFWKWYLAKNEDVEPLIKGMLGIKEAQPKVGEKNEALGCRDAEPKEEPKAVQAPIAPEKPAEKEKVLKRKEPKRGLGGANKGKSSDFLQGITGYFAKNSIRVIEKEIVRKEKEIDFIIQLESVFGLLMYYCKAKDKLRVTDADLSSAYVQGQLRKLPVIFLSRGEPTKKAKEMLGKEFKAIVFRKL